MATDRNIFNEVVEGFDALKQAREDHELLKLAAKAAGVDYHIDHLDGCPKLVADGRVLNPLFDDGDALRLHAIMAFNVYYIRPWVFVQDPEYASGVSVTEEYDDDLESKLTATRRAIVRAAAEIGRAMP